MIKKLRRKRIDKEEELGFGSVASDSGDGRLLNRDGSFNVERRGLDFFSSLNIYHHLLTTTWPRFIAWTSLVYILVNLVFAFIFMLFGRAALGGLKEGDFFEELGQAFFFSVQTSSTIGYGHITPVSNGANMLVTLESFTGLFGIALVTGLVFARFSRPQAHILFSKKVLISPFKDIRALMFRIVNGRKNQLIELSAQLNYSHVEEKNGQRKRVFNRLKLEIERIPFFPLSWTIVHPIDENSPLNNVDHKELLESEAEFLILLTGIDDTFNQTVFSRSSYTASEVLYGAKFKRIFCQPDKNGPMIVNIDKLSKTETVELK